MNHRQRARLYNELGRLADQDLAYKTIQLLVAQCTTRPHCGSYDLYGIDGRMRGLERY